MKFNSPALVVILALVAFVTTSRNVKGQVASVTTLYSFGSIDEHSANTNGAEPVAGVIQGSDGNFYGTTEVGGSGGFGTVYKINSNGGLTTLANLVSYVGNFYNLPVSGLVQGSDGNYYGTTSDGGSYGYGSVFMVTPAGVLTVLHNFGSLSSDGLIPESSLVQGSDGNFYGTTAGGGTNNYGTVFKITPSGVLTILHYFDNTDGTHPVASLVQGSDGYFYGTTEGNDAYVGGYGTVFKISSTGALTTLHFFAGGSDGEFPEAALLLSSGGNFFGTTYQGGNYMGGTVFRITPAGVLTTLYSFGGNGGDGANPQAALIQGRYDATFYGTTSHGGTFDYGTAFKITPGGVLTMLYGFSGSDGAYPYSSLVQGINGEFYGTTRFGGSSYVDSTHYGFGSVFELFVAPTITSATTATGTVGQPFSYQITAIGTVTSFGAQGLGHGLTINGSGLISGTPNTVGTFMLTLNAHNGSSDGTAPLTLTISPPAPVITSPATAIATYGDYFGYGITATNNPTSYSINMPLIPGLSNSGAPSGSISGSPQITGTFYITLTAHNSGGDGTEVLKLTIVEVPPVIYSNNSASGTVGQRFGYQIMAEHGPTSYSISNGSIPPGLSFNSTTGLISGTPTVAGNYSLTVNASNDAGTGSAALSLGFAPTAPIITSANTAVGSIGTTFNYQITAYGNPTSYGASGLPATLNVNTATGLISGTPTVGGQYTVVISASNALGQGQGSLGLTIGN